MYGATQIRGIKTMYKSKKYIIFKNNQKFPKRGGGNKIRYYLNLGGWENVSKNTDY